MDTEYLFQNFMGNRAVYDEAQAFWRSICQRILAKYGWSDLWKPLPVDVLPEYDVPERGTKDIYALINHEQLKSVLIIQQDPKIHTKWEMAAWVNILGDEYSDPAPVKELVFTCNLTQKTAAVFEKLFEQWIQPSCQIEDINKTIDELYQE